MTLRTLILLGLAALLSCPSSLRAQSTVSSETVLPHLESGEIRRARNAQSPAVAPRQIGMTRRIDRSPAADEWTPVGHLPIHTWRHRIVAPGAMGLSLFFDRFNLPPGATLTIGDAKTADLYGPYTAHDATENAHSTPIVWDDTLVVELTVPDNARDRVDLRIRDVVHAFASLRPTRGAKSGSCNVDVACSEADPYRDQVRSVATYTYIENGGQFVCTGALINNSAFNARPFFLTAEHCISTPNAAVTAVFYWNYENSTCRAPGSPASGTESDDNRQEETSSGAIMRARAGNVHRFDTIFDAPDLVLLELDDPADLSTFGVYYSGWDASGTAPEQAVSIHHPRGDAKRISFEQDPLQRTAYFGSTPDPSGTHWRIGAWDLGTTEAGSSGSPLFGENKRIIGVLSGGDAACASEDSADDNNEPDWYGALAVGFDSTSYGDMTFREWLDPLGTGIMTLEGEYLENLPVELVSLSASGATESVTIRWETASETRTIGFRIHLTSNGKPGQRSSDVIAARGSSARGATYRHVMSDLTPGSYHVRLVDVTVDGSESTLGTTQATVGLTSNFTLTRPSPHPVRSRGTARLTVQTAQTVQVDLFDVLGRRVARLHDGPIERLRPLSIELDGSRLSAGTYLLRASGERFSVTERVVILP